MTTIYYNNISIPLDSGDTITGAFSVNYSSGVASLNSVNLQVGSELFNSVADPTMYDVSFQSAITNSYEFRVFSPDNTIIVMAYSDADLDGTSVQALGTIGIYNFTYAFNPADSSLFTMGQYSSYGAPIDGSLTAPACFTPGALISTPTGSTPVQDLRIGDLILNHLGQTVPVKWIGRQRIHPAFAGESLPICIKQGALGNDLPLRDLFVSPGHALYIDDCLLIDAKALVNGITITQVTQWEGDVEYLHIETEHHEIILAEGTPAETFIDNVSRTCFNNYSEYQALYPKASEMIELDIPRVSHQRQLPNAVKRQLEAISEVLMGDGDRVKERMVGVKRA
ncbi:Hint domain-containing protein [Polynucleobacter sp. JS-JIR-II-c23]|uniref:Hint domain-containing protein n=1 Tax=Polynucleobacter sp. JS-JIR-II-c23 TaxID=1758393 RepID=UPI002B233674|nr:Hint domain-containing protein [Polynucleobacter sp. JS-JIR-II-c23]MEA9603820.1 Hint domain-containing protein [Polynucleobacter sp. JS-JIR-II-c23]